MSEPQLHEIPYSSPEAETRLGGVIDAARHDARAGRGSNPPKFPAAATLVYWLAWSDESLRGQIEAAHAAIPTDIAPRRKGETDEKLIAERVSAIFTAAEARDAEKERPLSPWQPTTDPIDLAHLGKLAEELCEAGAAVARCIIQGISEAEPVTGKPNQTWLEDEIADVMANLQLVVRRFKLDEERMGNRVLAKMRHLQGWHQLLGQP